MARRRGFGTGRNGARLRRLSRHIETLPSQSASSNPPRRSGRPGTDAAPGPGPGRTHDSVRAKRSQTVGDRGGQGVARAVTGAAQSGAQRQSSGQGGAPPPRTFAALSGSQSLCLREHAASGPSAPSRRARVCWTRQVGSGSLPLQHEGRVSTLLARLLDCVCGETPRGRCGERARPPARSHRHLSGGGRRLPVAIGDGEGDGVVTWCRELVCRVGHG